MRTTLIITTYNRPDVLSLVLDSIKLQSRMPDEVIIADDGSTSETADVVSQYARSYPLPLIHAWQEDDGFRAARVRNLGASKSNGDYLIFIDGDMVLHKHFVKSHVDKCQKGTFLHGPRVLLPTPLTTKILEEHKMQPIHLLNVPMSHRFNTIHSPVLSSLFSGKTNKAKSRACNLSLFMSDFVRINGFNEEFVGWGEEDSEFAWRLIKSGVDKVNLRFCATLTRTNWLTPAGKSRCSSRSKTRTSTTRPCSP